MAIYSKCKAVVIHGPGQASLTDVAIPQLQSGDVLIKVAYAGVCRTDLDILDGTLDYYRSGAAQYPIIPGHEVSGRVVKVDPIVEGLQEGDPVVVECIQSCGNCTECRKENNVGCPQRQEMGVMGRNGAYTEYLAVPSHFVHKLPEDLKLRDACPCEPVAVILKGLRRLGEALRTREQKCVVVGGGPIGHLCAQILAQQGHAVALVDQNPLRRGYIHKWNDSLTTLADLRTVSEYSIAVEATGNPELLRTLLQKTAAGTSILLFGLPYGDRSFNFETVVAYDKTIIGSVGSTSQDFENAIATLPLLKLGALTQQVFPLEEYESAWALCRNKSALKALLEIDPSATDSP